ncbi:type II secretion system F family protein [Amnibacterium endophyticum]|uniref:Type II secretion system F family protein n=1 Tax=Amnibacterium endophyticum TaxID=2109337 RepID=A0ABW4LB65_9MICO
MTAVLGIALCSAALLVATLLVAAPAGPRIRAARRRPPGSAPRPWLTRAAESLTGLIGRRMGARSGESPLATALELAGVRLTPPAFVATVLCAAVVGGALGLAVGGVGPLSLVLVPVGAAVAPVAARIVLVVRRDRRDAAFVDQLDDTLVLLTGSLRAGHSLLRAIDGAADESESPTREELTRVVNETRLGRDLASALVMTADRMRSEDMRWIAQAVAVNQEAGGNISEVLAQVATTIRERGQIRRQVKALSAEGRFSALILLALPIGVLLVLLVIRPGYLAPLFSEPLGWLALAASGLLFLVGGLWMRVAIKVKF